MLGDKVTGQENEVNGYKPLFDNCLKGLFISIHFIQQKISLLADISQDNQEKPMAAVNSS